MYCLPLLSFAFHRIVIVSNEWLVYRAFENKKAICFNLVRCGHKIQTNNLPSKNLGLTIQLIHRFVVPWNKEMTFSEKFIE